MALNGPEVWTTSTAEPSDTTRGFPEQGAAEPGLLLPAEGPKLNGSIS